MELPKNDWGQRDTINTIIILTKIDLDTIHAAILTKYCKYASTTILTHANFLAKVNKLSYGSFPNITPHDAYSITIHVRTVTLLEISYK